MPLTTINPQTKSTDSLRLQSIDIADTTTLKTDTLTISVEIPSLPNTGHNGILKEETLGSTSLILSFLIILFVLICIRFSKNFRYLTSLLKNLTEVRQRNNLFDDTIRESSFLFLLNCAYIVSIAIIFHETLMVSYPHFTSLPILGSFGICMAISALFVIWQYATYYLLGNIFSDVQQTSVWVKGATTCQAIGGVILFPFAMISIFYSEWLHLITIIGIIIFIITKIIFIFRGFRIFFAQYTSLISFLYYLCSVEIIPIIFSYLGAIEICELFI